jgi:ATP-dependent Clp protease ATP-binding subunit ClpA
LAERASAAASPDEALALVKALRDEIDDFERQHVARALTLGEPVSAIARALGVSRQSAHRRFRDLVPPRQRSTRPRPTPEAKLAVEYARREARRLGAAAVSSEHLVLGILRSGDCATVEALASLGVTLPATRAAARAITAAQESEPRVDDEVRTVLAEALRAAIRERAGQVGIEHLLIGALMDPAGGAAQLLRALGVSPEAAGARVGEAR